MRVFISKDIRMNMENVYNWSPYNKAIDEAKQYINVDGVKERLTRFDKDADNYNAKLSGLLERERVVENDKYNHFKSLVQKHNICVWVGIGLICIRFLLFCTMKAGYLEALYLLGRIATWAYIVTFIILRVKVIKAEDQYYSYKRNIRQQIGQINDNFLVTVHTFEEEVDQMYLNSLDPTTLQLVLMRRELSETQKKNEQLQKQMINEQTQMRKSQERSEEQIKNNGQIQQQILNNLNEWRDERHNRY